MIKKRKRTVLVAGGAGYIGSYLNKMLHKAGHETIVIDNLATGSRQSVLSGTFIEGDIANSSLLDKIFQTNKIDAVIHLAALINVGESFHHPSQYYRNNVVNTLVLLETMKKHSVQTFIFSSSAAVYGLPKEKRIKETHDTQPINPYGETKLMIEKVLRDFDQAYGLKSCRLRYFNATGGDPEGEIKNTLTHQQNLIPIILKKMNEKNGSVTIFGIDYPTFDGTCIRDFIHIHDLGNAHIMAMEQLWDGANSSTYNLGNSVGFSVRQVIEAAFEVTHLPVNIIEGMRRPGDPPCLIADATKARQELGWKCRYSDLEAMIAHAWKGMKDVS